MPRVYIECLHDKVIPLALQRQMHSKLPCQKVVSIDSDHSPFFSAPQKLTEILTGSLSSANPVKTGEHSPNGELSKSTIAASLLLESIT